MGTDREKLFSICQKEGKKEKNQPEGGGKAGKRGKKATNQVCDDFLEELCTFFHLVLGPSQLNDVALLSRVGKINDDLEVDSTPSMSGTRGML